MELKFDITGMTCAACSARVEKVAGEVPGITKAEVNLLAGKLTVYADNAGIGDAVIAAVIKNGYGASYSGQKKASEHPLKNQPLKEMKCRLILSVIFLVVLMYFTMGSMVGLPMPGWYMGTENALVGALLQFILVLPILYLNRSYFSKGTKALLNRAPNMDSLIAVGSGAALVYSVVNLFGLAYAAGHGQTEHLARVFRACRYSGRNAYLLHNLWLPGSHLCCTDRLQCISLLLYRSIGTSGLQRPVQPLS